MGAAGGPTHPPASPNPACPPHVLGTVLNILSHLLNEDHGPLIMLIFLNEYAGSRKQEDAPVGAEPAALQVGSGPRLLLHICGQDGWVLCGPPLGVTCTAGLLLCTRTVLGGSFVQVHKAAACARLLTTAAFQRASGKDEGVAAKWRSQG